MVKKVRVRASVAPAVVEHKLRNCLGIAHIVCEAIREKANGVGDRECCQLLRDVQHALIELEDILVQEHVISDNATTPCPCGCGDGPLS